MIFLRCAIDRVNNRLLLCIAWSLRRGTEFAAGRKAKAEDVSMEFNAVTRFTATCLPFSGPTRQIVKIEAMASKFNPNVLYVRESLTSPDSQAEAGDESSDSDGEPEETSHKLIRKVSTSGQIRAKVRRVNLERVKYILLMG